MGTGIVDAVRVPWAYSRGTEVPSLAEPVEALILDLLEWLDATPRPYAEVMAAWRTSCPHLPVWEEANDRGFLERERTAVSGELVKLSPSGRSHLRHHRAVPTG